MADKIPHSIIFEAEPGKTLSPAASERLQERARRILNAATTLFLAHGFSVATTDMIQREAGVSKTALYECFANKEAMFVAVIKNQCAASAESIRGIQFTPGDLRNTLLDLGRAYLNIVLAPSGLALYRAVVAEAPKFPQLARTFYLSGPRVVSAMVHEILADAHQAGEVDVSLVGLDLAASMFAGLICHEAQTQFLLHPTATPSEAQIDTWVEGAVVTFLSAFSSRKNNS